MIINEKSYMDSLRAIKNGLEKEGYRCRINVDHRCVDVLDNNNSTIQQHYPEEVESKKNGRYYYKYTYAGEKQGSYNRSKVFYDKRDFAPVSGTIKHCKVVKSPNDNK